MTRPGTDSSADRLLTVEAAAERMSTSVRFVRRLIAERRIAFVKLGRHVRLTEADVTAFIECRAGHADGRIARYAHTKGELRNGERKQGRASTFRQHPASSVRPIPGELPGTGRATPLRPRDLRAQRRRRQERSSIIEAQMLRGSGPIPSAGRSRLRTTPQPGSASGPSCGRDGGPLPLAAHEAHRAVPGRGADRQAVHANDPGMAGRRCSATGCPCRWRRRRTGCCGRS